MVMYVVFTVNHRSVFVFTHIHASIFHFTQRHYRYLLSSYISSHAYVLFTFVFIIISLQSHKCSVVIFLVSQRIKEIFVRNLFLMDLIYFLRLRDNRARKMRYCEVE